MTHVAAKNGRGVPKAWLIPAALLALILLGIPLGLFSRAIVIDLLAWWPAWVILGLLAFFARGRRLGPVHAPALVPLLAVLALGVFVWGYVAGWEAMPSAVTRLNGPVEGPATTASLTARIDGEMDIVDSQLGFLYSAVPKRRGGDVGIPSAMETTQGSNTDVELKPDPESGLYKFAGWDVELSTVPIWELELAGEIEADLTGLVITAIRVDGSGALHLGVPPADAPVSVLGEFIVTVPSGTAVAITGSATVPPSWQQTADGWISPGTGPGWLITVPAGSSLVMEEN